MHATKPARRWQERKRVGELANLASELRDLAESADELSHDLANPVGPRHELGDLVRQEFDIDVTCYADQLRLDTLVEEITGLVLAPYAESVGEFASSLYDLVDDEDCEIAACLDCDVDTAARPRLGAGSRARRTDACIGCLEKRIGRRLEPRDFAHAVLNDLPNKSARLRSRLLGFEETHTWKHRRQLADDLAVTLAGADDGLSCDTLARRVRRRRTDVLTALEADPRFVRSGRTQASRWRLAALSPPRAHGTESQTLRGVVTVSVEANA